MFYRLKACYVLRGWEGLAWVLIKRPQNEIYVLQREVFDVLMLCDGETELVENLPDAGMQKALGKCLEKGLIESCERPHPLDQDQYYKYYKNRFVKEVQWSITGRCNYRCRHCYMDAPDAALGELSTEEMFTIIDQMANCGVLRVDLTGGEPFVRKDFWQLVDRIISYNIIIGTVYTNGWLLTDITLGEFEKRGLKPDFSISFDGVGWHDWMRGIPGAEEATLHAIKLCCDRGFGVAVTMCVHRGNIQLIPQTVEMLSKIGVEDFKTSSIGETELWRKYNEGNAMTWPELIEAMLPYITWYYKAGRPIKYLEYGGIAFLQQDGSGQLTVTPHDGTEACLDCYLCGAVRWSCYVAPDGRLLPCMPITSCSEQNWFPKVQDIGLKQGLSSSYYMKFANSRIKNLLAVNAECAACEYRYKCGGGCRAGALIDEHNLMGCDRGMCLFWKNRYDERILKTIREAEEKYGFAESVASETM